MHHNIGTTSKLMRPIARVSIIGLLALTQLASVLVSASAAQTTAPPSKAELAEITRRGRLLAEYDVAAWHATDAVKALKPVDGIVTHYIARKTDTGWVVVFGRLANDDQSFLAAFEAVQTSTPTNFSVKVNEPPTSLTGYFLNAAYAIDLARRNFTEFSRPYNVAVIPTGTGDWWVYLVPAPTLPGVWSHGADIRFRVAADGKTLLETRRLHKGLIEYTTARSDEELKYHFHTHMLDDGPVDTDVFIVLVRKPAVSEFIVSEKFVFVVEVDGTIAYLGTSKDILKR